MKITKYIVYLYKYLIKSKKEFTKPRKLPVLIYDRTGSELFFNYFYKDSVNVLDVRGESLNLYILIKVMFSGKFTFDEYLNQYIKYVSPKIVITFIDNSYIFYRQKKYNSSIIFIIVQNGVRGNSCLNRMAKLSDKFKDFKVDYFFANTEIIANIYKNILHCEVITIGSFKNNMIEKYSQLEQKISNKLIFLSQYREFKNLYLPIHTLDDGSKIFFNDFYMAEKELLSRLKSFCNTNKLEFVIVGAKFANWKSEFEFYENILGKEGWKFSPKDNVFSSYKEISNSKYIISIDSTLGFESLSAGKKAGIFSCREKFVPNRKFSFGSYNNLEDKGEFWTDDSTQEEFDRVINFVVNSSDEEWKHTTEKYMDNIMMYDPGNTKFISLMKQLSIPLKNNDNIK